MLELQSRFCFNLWEKHIVLPCKYMFFMYYHGIIMIFFNKLSESPMICKKNKTLIKHPLNVCDQCHHKGEMLHQPFL